MENISLGRNNMSFIEFVCQDWVVNKGNTKGRLILILFRTANFCATRKIYYYLGLPYLIFYRILVEWFFSIEIPWNTKIGKNLSLFHGQALVMTNKVIIGENCTIRHCTTIGNKQMCGGFTGSPIIGNHVDIGSNVCIIGPITISDYVKIGSGAVVVKDAEAHSTLVGNPAIERKKSIVKN